MSDIYIKAVSILEKIEKDGSVYDLRIEGIPLWWFVRVRFFEEMLSRLDQMEKVGSSKTGTLSLNRSVRYSFNNEIYFILRCVRTAIDIFVLRFPVRKSAIFLTGAVSISGRDKIDGYIDDYYNKISKDAIIVSRTTFRKTAIYPLLHCTNTFFLDLLILRGAFKFLLTFRSFKKIKIDGWDKFEQRFVNTGSNEDILKESIAVIKGLCISLYPKIYIQLDAANDLLSMVKPKLIVETTSYDSGVMAMNLIARKKNIHVIELQHGLITRNYPAYNYYIPDNFGSMLPLPNKIFIFGESSKREILASGNAFAAENLVVAGLPRLNNMLRETESGKNAIRKKVRRRIAVKEDDFLITIADQSGRYISDFVEKTLDILPNGTVIAVKMHPNADLGKDLLYKNILNHHSVRIVDGDGIDPYELLVASDACATVYSTILLESMALGLPSIAVQGPGCEMIMDLVGGDNIIKALSPEDFSRIISKIQSNPIYRKEIISKSLNRAKFFYDQGRSFEEITNEEILKIIK